MFHCRQWSNYNLGPQKENFEITQHPGLSWACILVVSYASASRQPGLRLLQFQYSDAGGCSPWCSMSRGGCIGHTLGRNSRLVSVYACLTGGVLFTRNGRVKQFYQSRGVVIRTCTARSRHVLVFTICLIINTRRLPANCRPHAT